MNFVAHLEVARRQDGPDDPALHLGAMLPDLLNVTSLRTGPLERWPASVAAGIRCHRQTDAVFHADRRFVGGMAAMRDDLTAAGLGRGQARAAAHVGWELLLDLTLLETPDVRAAYLRALSLPVAEFGPVGEPGEVEQWAHLVAAYRDRGLPERGDPTIVAQRVVGILARRPRLAVDPAHTAELTRVFERHHDEVVTHGAAVIAATADAVARASADLPTG